MKYLTSFVIGVLLSAAGFWAYLQFGQPAINSAQVQQPANSVQNTAPVSATQPAASDLIQNAKDSANEMVYLVTADKIGDNWKTFLKFPDTGSFSFQSSGPEGDIWGPMRYIYSDLTASDSGAPLDAFAEIGQYSFCAGGYACDEKTKTGMGFVLDFWNAKYNNPTDPGYYPNSGETIVLKTDKFVIGYKPFAPSGCSGKNIQENYCTGQQKQITDEVNKLFDSFKFN